jgi:hypothetical protein
MALPRVPAALTSLVLALLGSACMAPPAERCGASMYYDEAQVTCLCVESAIPVGGSCIPCAPDEVAAGSTCACPEGQAKNDEGVCAAVAGLGDPCDATSPCTDPTYSYCAPRSGGATAGTCTRTCFDDAQCDGAYTCATWEAQPYCRRFSGLGMGCASSADCADTDATFCDTFQTHTCLVSGCTARGEECPRGTECCDLSTYGLGTLCLGACL